MRGKRKRVVAVLIVLALLAAACAGREPEPTSAPEAKQSAESAKAMVDEALGGTQAVQDFLVYLDMSVQTDDGTVSYYHEVLDRAAEGSADPIELEGGSTLSAVDSLEGDVRDSSGGVIPSLSLSFGVLRAGTEARAAGAEALAAVLAASAPDAPPFEFDVSDDGGRGLLVQIFTADFAEARTHVGPGDVGAVDLTFVSSIAPGDDLRSAYILGQTFPGDPAEEAGLSPHELFAYRWDRGLVGALGNDGEVGLHLDDTVVAIEGSTIVLTEPKAAAVEAAKAEDGMHTVGELLDATTGVIRLPDGRPALVVEDEGDGMETHPIRLEMTLDQILDAIALNKFWACVTEVLRLLQRNQAMFGHALDTGVPHQTGPGSTPSSTQADVDPEPQPRPAAEEYCLDPPTLFDLLAAGTYGDVHVTTFDGSSYDNQAAGEFLVFDNGTATVQVRQAPWPGSDAVSIITAIAVGVGDHEISMHPDFRVWVDGEELTLARGETVAVGDAALLWTGGGWVTVWPDGTEVRVQAGQLHTAGRSATAGALLMLITAPEGDAVGMFGSPDRDWTNDWVTRSGELLDPEIRFDFDAFYPTYVDTWRISDDESLFHYEAGESTATFTIEGFPRVKFDLDDLDPDTRADAEAACVAGGIERPAMLEGCILDVSLTGDYGFVFDTYLVQSNTPPAAEDPPPPADGESFVTIGPLAVDFGPDPAVVIPDTPVEWVCQVSEGSFDAFSEFQESTGRLISVSIVYRDAPSSGTGEEQVTIVVLLNRRAYAWVQAGVDPSAGSLDDLSLNGRTLTAKGAAFLNDPLDTDLNQTFPLPEGAVLQPLTLQVSCDS